ncbi:hypothetical protein V6Z11_A12G041700 [Gossypium hirsutum]
MEQIIKKRDPCARHDNAEGSKLEIYQSSQCSIKTRSKLQTHANCKDKLKKKNEINKATFERPYKKGGPIEKLPPLRQNVRVIGVGNQVGRVLYTRHRFGAIGVGSNGVVFSRLKGPQR